MTVLSSRIYLKFRVENFCSQNLNHFDHVIYLGSRGSTLISFGKANYSAGLKNRYTHGIPYDQCRTFCNQRL